VSERSDQEWVRLIKLEDTRCITDLWRLLFTWALAITKRYNVEEDLGRDGAVAAFWRIKERGVYQYRFQGPFLGFCRRILVNEVHRLMHPSPAMVDVDDPQLNLPTPPPPEQTADAQIIQARLQPCMEQLSARESEILSLLYMRDMTPQGVADQLSIARNHANVIAFRARSKLRDCLEQRGYASSEDLLSL
jgi:RNA polymerase sigma factor (sigma-70 family)